ncbi:MAG: cell pole-organizing protein PopZ [Alphaproteobacteria bacterium]|jgi:cell pole-organizing protein PopZ
MEDILASIRETVEDEVEKNEAPASEPSEVSAENEAVSENIDENKAEEKSPEVDSSETVEADEALAAMADAQASLDAEKVGETIVEETQETAAEDILELTDVVENGDSNEDLIDVDKFSSSGEIATASENSVQESRDSYNEEDDIDVDMDGIMNELEQEGELASTADSLPNEEDAKTMMTTPAADDAEAEVLETPAPVEEAAIDEPIAAVASEKVVEQAVTEMAQKVFLPTTPSAKGLQVSFPAEVLAEALRPLVTGWIEDNLADIVERLVKEELSKLVEK